jgi:hypothetical protein
VERKCSTAMLHKSLSLLALALACAKGQGQRPGKRPAQMSRPKTSRNQQIIAIAKLVYPDGRAKYPSSYIAAVCGTSTEVVRYVLMKAGVKGRKCAKVQPPPRYIP